MNAVFDNPSVEYEGATPIRIHWFCTHEAMHRTNPPGTHSDHLHPDIVEKVPEHVMYVPEHGSDAINALLAEARAAREEWCGLRFVPFGIWNQRKGELDSTISLLENQRGNIRVTRVVRATPKDLFINVCQHGDDRANDKSCSVSLKAHPSELPEYDGA